MERNGARETESAVIECALFTRPRFHVGSDEAQWAHFLAFSGMMEAHSGHSFVLAGGGGDLVSLFTCLTIRKITKLIMRKSKTAWMKLP